MCSHMQIVGLSMTWLKFCLVVLMGHFCKRAPALVAIGQGFVPQPRRNKDAVCYQSGQLYLTSSVFSSTENIRI